MPGIAWIIEQWEKKELKILQVSEIMLMSFGRWSKVFIGGFSSGAGLEAVPPFSLQVLGRLFSSCSYIHHCFSLMTKIYTFQEHCKCFYEGYFTLIMWLITNIIFDITYPIVFT